MAAVHQYMEKAASCYQGDNKNIWQLVYQHTEVYSCGKETMDSRKIYYSPVVTWSWVAQVLSFLLTPVWINGIVMSLYCTILKNDCTFCVVECYFCTFYLPYLTFTYISLGCFSVFLPKFVHFTTAETIHESIRKFKWN